MVKDIIGIDVLKDCFDVFWYFWVEVCCLFNIFEGFE